MSGSQRANVTDDIAALIVGVDASDLTRARKAISGGIKVAQQQWVPTHLIVSALALELQEQIAGEEPSAELTMYLRRLADFVSAEIEESDRH